MLPFKIGNTIICHLKEDDNPATINNIGTIIAIRNEQDNPYLVSFKKRHSSFHTGNQRGPENSCWWCTGKSFQLHKEYNNNPILNKIQYLYSKQNYITKQGANI